MSEISLSKRPVFIVSILSLVATLAAGGYFYYQHKVVNDSKVTPPFKPATANVSAVVGIKAPSAADVLSTLFGVKVTSDKVNNAADQLSSLWFEQTFSRNNENFLAVFIKSQTIDPDSKTVEASHADSAKISIVVYQEVDKQWQLFSKQLNVGDFGSWGDVPEVKQVSVMALSADNLAFLVEDGSSGQGYTEAGKGIFSLNLKTKLWKDLGFVQTGGDNSGACDDSPQPADSVLSACWVFTGEITLTKNGKNPDYPDLLIVEKGTTSDDNNKVIPVSNRSYVFNGEQYVEQGAEAR